MNNESQQAHIDAALQMAPGPKRDSLIASLDTVTRTEVERLVAVGDLVWESQFAAPPIEEDPIAAMLGLVANQKYRLDAKAFGRARKSARLSGGDLARRLTERGWDITTRDVFTWETQGPVALPPAIVRAIADTVGTTPERLTLPTTAEPVAFSETAAPEPDANASARVRGSKRFEDLVARYARLYTVPLAQAATALEGRMVATVHRGTHPDSDQMISSLEALMDALEARTTTGNLTPGQFQPTHEQPSRREGRRSGGHDWEGGDDWP